MLRPILNAWLAQYVSGYPAIFHLVPILGIPISVVALVQKISDVVQK